MATLTILLDTEFTPAVGDFNAQVTGGTAHLVRKNSAGAAFALVQSLCNQAAIVSNPIAGAVFKFTALQAGSTVAVQADQ